MLGPVVACRASCRWCKGSSGCHLRYVVILQHWRYSLALCDMHGSHALHFMDTQLKHTFSAASILACLKYSS